MPPPEHWTAFSTCDPDAAAHFLQTAYATGHRLSLPSPPAPGGGPVVAPAQHRAGPLQVAEALVDPQVVSVIDPSDTITVNVIRAGVLETRIADATSRHGAGDVLIGVGPRLARRHLSQHLAVHTLSLPAALIAAAAGRPAEDTERPWDFTSTTPLNAHASMLWRTTSAYIATMLRMPPQALGPLLIGNLARLAASTLLTAFPTTLGGEARAAPYDRTDATPPVLRRAIAFIDANPHRDIALADIAAAAHASPRALQYAFRRHLDTTPTAYLRRVRLEAAHRDLHAGTPATTTVTEIALRWGFASPSRLAAEHRAAYRTLPSQVLRDGH
ncbi:hypothetical protein BIV57_01115 [Mangrovactinospora gilvigrisea]|uniref:HTH araC/xylS-type domain-containing protein n=1 Tax=Mangrovactinospora gilvigrisea TaxID=1428644 RepID=A0A1J7CD22_9ACTN|nr:helix-turn-helix domain-containing protein [Mangrovactinospora gilvigrisea]OIV39464.1 hypothetical protein BIV57_01115 [Mangrovactinospora gilvigrisea]